MNTRQQGREAVFITAVKIFDLTDLRSALRVYWWKVLCWRYPKLMRVLHFRSILTT